jgi:F0F1-type ATP synthase membrane subunit b/b'
LKAIEGLAGQSEVLRNVSENLLSQIHNVTNRFEGQGQAIMSAASTLENANLKIDTTLQGRHAELAQTLDRLSGKADEFGRFVEGYSSTIEGSLTEAEKRARATAEQLRQSAEMAKQTALADLERFRVEAGAEGDRALEDLRRRFSSISSVVNEQLSTLTSRIDQTSDDVRARATRAAADIAAEQSRLRDQMERLPAATRESAEAMRHALQDQLRALEQLSNLTSRSFQNRGVSPPVGQPPSASPYGGGYQQDTGGRRALSSLSASVASELAHRGGPKAPEPQRQQAALPRPGGAPAADQRHTWTLGDLLARASRDDEGHQHPPSSPQAFRQNIEIIARALDPATTSAIWACINAGQRGVMVRSIYSPEGRAVFDEITRRYKSDPDLQRTVNRYLADFEHIRRDAEQRDPSGRLVHEHLLSDMGRVYLFLAHASGRVA